ncbi:MAG TPA: hypothetical protein VMU05_20290 [Dongiaceae bacterium]|nr:hypothetical protein [Dongiaceae bacterium]
MANYVALRDRRLQGGVPNRPRLTIINTDENTSLRSAFAQINAAARTGRINTLFILCHGFAGENTRGAVCMDAGGMGLLLGKENMLHGNVSMWRAIANKIDNIVVYACGAGDTQPGNEGTTADGKYLMGALAIHTNASVFAADKIQWYSTFQNSPHGRFDFGDWEGTLWDFPPTGTAATPVLSAPVEFADVMSGTAP